MEWISCNKQYVGKAETSSSVRLNNQQKDGEKVGAIMACKHFQQEGQNFNKHAKFTIIDHLMNTSKSKETLTLSVLIQSNPLLCTIVCVCLSCIVLLDMISYFLDSESFLLIKHYFHIICASCVACFYKSYDNIK